MITEVSIRYPKKNRRLVYGIYPPIHHCILGIRGGSYCAGHIVEYDVIQCITYFKFSMPPQEDRAMAVSNA